MTVLTDDGQGVVRSRKQGGCQRTDLQGDGCRDVVTKRRQPPVDDLRPDPESHFAYEEFELTEPLGLLGMAI